MIVRIAVGSKDPAAVLKIMRDGAAGSAQRAKLRGLPEDASEELRQHLKGSIDRFFVAMRIEPGAAQSAASSAAAKGGQAASAPSAKPKAPVPSAAPKPKAPKG